MDDFSIGDLNLKPGSRGSTLLEVAKRPDGSAIGIPVIVIHGGKPGPVMALDAGCHGDEHEGARTILHLANTLDPEELTGTIVMTMALHLPAFETMSRGNPFDHWNGDMNRLFPGSPNGNLTQRLAHAYMELIGRRADFSVSIHSGATYIHWAPVVVLETTHEPSLELAKLMGPEWDVLYAGTAFQGTSKQALNELGVPAIGLELGGAAQRFLGDFDRNVDMLASGLRNLMVAKGMLDGEARRAENFTTVRMQAVRSGTGGVVVPDSEFKLRWQVTAGTPLLRLFDLYGREAEVVTAPFDGLIMGVRTYPYAPAGWPLVWMGEVLD